jgi:hypothetical protein
MSHVWLITGVLLTVIGTACTVYGTILANRETSSQLLQNKNEIIEETSRFVTGGDSFIYIKPSKVSNSDTVMFLTEFNGNYPIFDVTLSINEYDYRTIEKGNFKWVSVENRKVQYGTVNPLKQFESLDMIHIPDQPEQFGKKYFIKIDSRNSMIECMIILRRNGKHFSMAYKVVRFLPKYKGKRDHLDWLDRIDAEVRHVDMLFPIHELDHLDGDSGWRADYKIQSGLRTL